MKILQINCVYKFGSTGKIVDSIGQALRNQGHEVFTCYGNGDSNYDMFSQKICTNFEHKLNALLLRVIGIPYGGVYFSNAKFEKIVLKYHPDVVHVHCINGRMINVYRLFKFLGKNGIKTVVTLHAEIFHTAGCSHAYDCEKYKTQCENCEWYKTWTNSFFFERAKLSWSLMNNAFSYFDPNKLIVTAVSPWLAERAKQSAILRKRPVEYVPNGVDTDIFHYKGTKHLIGIEHYDNVVLFVSAYFGTEEDDLKGGSYLIQIANCMPKIKFVVVASQIAKGLPPLPSNIQIWGKAKDQVELAQLYSEADVSIVLSRRETFSMVTAESLCCGTPVVGFKAGGPESIALATYSEFVDYGNVNAMKDSIFRWLKSEHDKNLISAEAADAYSKENMANCYMQIFNKMVLH